VTRALGLWWSHRRAVRAWQAHEALLAIQGEAIDWRDYDEKKADLTSDSIIQDTSRLEALLLSKSNHLWKLPKEYKGWRAGQTYPYDQVFLPRGSRGVYRSREESLRVLEAFY